MTPILLILGTVFSIVPALIALYYVWHYSVEVPYYDQWNYVPMLERWFEGKGTWHDLIIPYNGHVILIPKLITIMSAWLGHWSVLTEIWVGFVCLMATGVLLLFMLLRCCREPGDRVVAVWAFVPISLVLFSLRQWENLLGPWADYVFGANFLVIASLLLARSRSYWGRVLSVTSAIAASLTFTTGLLAWPTVAIEWLVARQRDAVNSRNKFMLRVWVPIAIALFGLFAWNMYDTDYRTSLEVRILALRFFIAIGAQLSPSKGLIAQGAFPNPLTEVDLQIIIMVGIGLLGLVCGALLAVCRSKNISESSTAIALLSYGFMACMLIAAGRSSLGVEQAASSRYTTLTVGLPIGILLLLVGARKMGKFRDVALGAFLALLILSNAIALSTELSIGPSREDFLKSWAEVICRCDTATDAELANPHFSPTVIRERCTFLRDRRLSLFADD
jgi:hypothetical protein